MIHLNQAENWSKNQGYLCMCMVPLEYSKF